MASNGPFAKLSCETIDTPNGVETVFSGKTRNAPDPIDNGQSSEFSGVVDSNGKIKGTYKELEDDNVILSASTDGSGFRNVERAGPVDEPLAATAQKALTEPAKACSRMRMPFPANG